MEQIRCVVHRSGKVDAKSSDPRDVLLASILGWVEVGGELDAQTWLSDARIVARQALGRDVFLVKWENASSEEKRLATERGDVTKGRQ